MENVTAILILFSIGTVLSGVAGRDRYSNSWAVEVRGGVEKAEELARHHGFVNLGQVHMSHCDIPCIYIFQTPFSSWVTVTCTSAISEFQMHRPSLGTRLSLCRRRV